MSKRSKRKKRGPQWTDKDEMEHAMVEWMKEYYGENTDWWTNSIKIERKDEDDNRPHIR